MRIIKKAKQFVRPVEASRTFIVPAKERDLFIEDMANHGWKTASVQKLSNPNFYWCLMVPATVKLAAGIKTKPKVKPKQKKPEVAAPTDNGTEFDYQYRPAHLTTQEIANEINFSNVDTDDPALDMSSGLASKLTAPEKDSSDHPFRREHAFSEGKPEFVRFMWNPWSGEMLVTADTSTDHSRMLANYSRKLKNKGEKTHPFDAWIRGYYNPKDESLMLRPWDWPLQGKEQDPLEERRKDSIGRAIKSRLVWMLSEQLGLPSEELSKKTNFYLNEDDLRGLYGTMRRF